MPDIADGFKILRNGVQDFADSFHQWMKDKNQQLVERAIQLRGIIQGLQRDIESCALCLYSVLVVESFSQAQWAGTLSPTLRNSKDSNFQQINKLLISLKVVSVFSVCIAAFDFHSDNVDHTLPFAISFLGGSS